MTELLDAGLAFHDAGCAVLPTRADGSKAPGVPTWRMYQKDRPTRSQVERWLTSGAYHGFGVITGAVSGHLEMLELEGRAVQAGLGDQLADLVTDAGLGDLWKRITDGYQETTPSGGVHLLYRVTDGEAKGNTKLARDSDGQVLIETRGEGGYVVVAPSNGATHPSGKPWALKTGGPDSIAAITGDERDALHAVCTALDRTPEPAPEPHHELRARRDGDRLTPGDDYNARARWTEILEPHGWARVSQRGHTTYWRRPGKQVGISATTGRNDGDNLYVFSTSTEFDQEKPYSKFAAYTLLEHGSDFRAAARALAQRGYGEPLPQPQARDQPGVRPTTPDSGLNPAEGRTEPRWVDELAPVDDTDAPDDPPEPAAAATAARQTEPDDEAFWTSRPVLDHIRAFARARRVSPWATLGVVLARVITATPPFVVLPALVGGHGSLNLFVGLVGLPGAGKGTAEHAASECIDLGVDIETAGVGSGEGIAHMFCTRTKNDVDQHTEAVLFTIAEIDTLTALGDRRGATLLPELRKAWSGERLGFAYADPTKRLPLPAHKYRLTMVAGIQPERAQHLLDDQDAGTPQRFLWLPATDPHAPDVAPDEPEPLHWARPTWPIADARTHHCVLPVCDTARDVITTARLARLRGNGGDNLDGHLLYAHLKTAAALALLDQRAEVDDDDWKLAEQVMAVSAQTRAGVVEHIQRTASERIKRRGAEQGVREVVAEEVIDEARVKTVCGNLLRQLRQAGGRKGHAVMRRALKKGLRDYFDVAVERLTSTGQIVPEVTERDSDGHGGQGQMYVLREG